MYHALFCVILFLTFLSHVLTRTHKDIPTSPAFRHFQSKYLLLYLLAVTADWLQGPFIYALYSTYGFSNTRIAHLYIAGFASSAIFGTFIASIADKYGRRNNAICYCITYILSCLTKHSSSFQVLFLGRILGGISTSILFSAFEAWMLHEHSKRAFDASLLPLTFSRAQFGNATVAILSGQLAGLFADRYGKVIPFDISIIVLLLLSILLLSTWVENYGNSTTSTRATFSVAFKTLLSNPVILLLGASQAAFEAALYTFTFVWTPALQHARGQRGEIPHGTIFSTFMACVMIGTNIFSFVQTRVKLHNFMRYVFTLGAVAFCAAAVSDRIEVIFASFLLFEVLCGVYYPGMATMRAPYIPKECRSAILTFFRIPLNLIVVIALYADLKVKTVFRLCAVLMIIAVVCQQQLLKLVNEKKEKDMDHSSLIEKGFAMNLPED